jgi:hypothetical protein
MIAGIIPRPRRNVLSAEDQRVSGADGDIVHALHPAGAASWHRSRPVRDIGCCVARSAGSASRRWAGTLACPNRHKFDLARDGYVTCCPETDGFRRATATALSSCGTAQHSLRPVISTSSRSKLRSDCGRRATPSGPALARPRRRLRNGLPSRPSRGGVRQQEDGPRPRHLGRRCAPGGASVARYGVCRLDLWTDWPFTTSQSTSSSASDAAECSPSGADSTSRCNGADGSHPRHCSVAGAQAEISTVENPRSRIKNGCPSAS